MVTNHQTLARSASLKKTKSWSFSLPYLVLQRAFLLPIDPVVHTSLLWEEERSGVGQFKVSAAAFIPRKRSKWGKSFSRALLGVTTGYQLDYFWLVHINFSFLSTKMRRQSGRSTPSSKFESWPSLVKWWTKLKASILCSALNSHRLVKRNSLVIASWRAATWRQMGRLTFELISKSTVSKDRSTDDHQQIRLRSSSVRFSYLEIGHFKPSLSTNKV